MNRFIVVSSFVILFTGDIHAQSFHSGNFLLYIDSVISAMPSGIGTNEYKTPTSTQGLLFGTAVEHCLTKKYTDAQVAAKYFGYHVIAFTDTTTAPNRLYYILLRGRDSSNHWGTFVFNPSPRRSKLVIQSPHELFDTKTGAQGAYVFQELSALAFFLNGSHRCNSATASQCSGTTTACGGVSAPFKISDQAHSVDGTFQLGTIILLQQKSDAIVVQLHGFGKGTGDPDLIMGNGTNKSPINNDYLLQLKNALSTIDTSLTFKVAHIDTSWTELTGTTNTQGRLINNSENPCSTKPGEATGKFLHIEQAYSKLRDTKTNWKKVSDALGIVFPAEPTSVKTSSSKLPNEFLLLTNYPNPFNPTTVIYYKLPSTGFTSLKVYDDIGREVAQLVNEVQHEGEHTVQFDGKILSNGVYIVRLFCEGKFQLMKMLLIK
ncbi:MAG: T9SS type A sorting domain-containing protein [Bacteroidota bacterium]